MLDIDQQCDVSAHVAVAQLDVDLVERALVLIEKNQRLEVPSCDLAAQL
jgi:hypothetical protein